MSSRIDVNRYLQAGDTFRSDNNEYRLVFQEDSNFVLYTSSDEPIWSSDTWSESGAAGRSIVVQPDGNIVLYEGEGNAIWATGSNYDAQSPYLKIQDDGNLVLLDDHVEGTHWASNTSR